jgi:hypothetical protein
MDHREIGWEAVDWMQVAQDRVNTVMNLRFHKGEEFLD